MEATVAERRAQSFRSLLDDRHAFRAWYDEALPVVCGFAFARSGGDANLATEITQEAFITAIRRCAQFDGRSDPTTWICGIARHKCADHFRRLARDRRRHLALVRQRRPQTSGPSGEVDARSAVVRALQGLPESQKAVLVMHYVDDMSVRDISSALGRSESSVESLLTRGRVGFRRAYDPISGGSDGPMSRSAER